MARSVLDWLLEKEDPGVRAFTLRDLLGAPADDPDVRAARRATVRQPPVRPILEAMEDEGYWVKRGGGYAPKYTGTVWQVIFLGQFGADGSASRIRRAGDYVLDHSRSPLGGFGASGSEAEPTPAGMIHCLQGNLGASLLELGFGDDPRLKEALDWLARSITGEGIAPAKSKDPVRFYRSGNSAPGFACSANNHKPCAWGAIPAMDALSRVPPRSRTLVMRRAIKTGVDFLLSRDPAGAMYPMGWGVRPNGSWFKFGYPMGYVTDVLRNAEVLVALGKGRDRRMRNLAALILAKRDEEGRWPLEYSYQGKTWFDLGRKRTPNKWITLRALRALKGMGVDE
ncbi:MAG TPA: hypothetical protein VFI11_11895 [Anaerolineales bacterium]|nr:hypothetical protein [Anaerolineales bacterium]